MTDQEYAHWQAEQSQLENDRRIERIERFDCAPLTLEPPMNLGDTLIKAGWRVVGNGDADEIRRIKNVIRDDWSDGELYLEIQGPQQKRVLFHQTSGDKWLVPPT